MLVTLKTLIAIELLLVLGLGCYRFALAGRYKDVVSAKAAGLVLLTPVVALLVGNIFLFYAYLVAVVAFTSRTRAELCGVYVLLLPSTPFLGMETAAGSVYLLPLSAPFMLSLGALIGLAVTPPPPGGTIRARYDWAFVLLLVLFTYIGGRDVSATSIIRTILGTGVTLGAPYYLFSRAISRVEDLDRVLLRLGLAATSGAVIGLFETARHWVLFQSYYDSLHVTLPMLSATLNLRGGWLRSGGPIIDFTAAGVFLATALVLMPYLLTRFRPGWRWAIVLGLVAGLAATQSRGAWIAAVVGFLFVLAYRGAWAKVGWVAAGAVALQISAFAVSAGNERFAEMIGAGGASSFTADYRKQLFWRGLDEVWAHPLFGQQPRQLTRSMSDLEQGQHIVDFVNTHLYVAMVAGVPLFLAWLTIWIAPVLRAWRLRSAAPSGSNPAELPAAIVVAVMVALTATSLIDRNMSWLMIALGLASPCFGLAKIKQTRAEPRPVRRLVLGMPPARQMPDAA